MVHVPTVADKYRQGIGDTVSVCQANDELTAYYVNGFAYKPHYPVPVIPWTDTSSLNYWVNGVSI